MYIHVLAMSAVAGRSRSAMASRFSTSVPFTEYDKYGDATGHTFVRCPECGVEVLESDTATASHRPACRFE
jgi:hypothetical protein